MDAPSSTTSLIRKRTDTDLMPPPPPAKRIKRPKNVLDEDTYTDALSQIIARDFFPGLLESQTQQEYLDALESKDAEWISIATRRLQHVMTPGRRVTPLATPRARAGRTPSVYSGETPASTAAPKTADENAAAEAAAAVDTSLSLADFQAKYTSEDNESFYTLIERQNQKKALKYAWLWTGNKMPSKMQLKQLEVKERLSRTRGLEDDGFGKTDLLAIKDKDTRPAAPDTWKWGPINGLMFNPEGVEDKVETIIERAEAESRAAPKAIVYANTRVPDPNIVVSHQQRDPARPPSPTLTAVRDALAGRPRPGDQDSAAASSMGGGAETPRVNGYSFVDDGDEPTFPGEDGKAVAESIIKLGAGDGVRNPFQIKERGKREELHHRMVDRIAESRRTSARLGMTGKSLQTPVPKLPHTPRANGGLTPAAQRLWTNLGTSERTNSLKSFDGRSTPKATPRSRTPLLKRAAK